MILFSYQGDNLMKSKIAVFTLLASTITSGYSINTLAQTCYDATGFVSTENMTSTLQIGEISLELSDQSGLEFSETGSLAGNITGGGSDVLAYLSHTARFSQGDSFVTNGDAAVLDVSVENGFNPVRDFYFDDNGVPVACSFWVKENISDIIRGTRFFQNVVSVHVTAQGYISNCPNENLNYFELSGELCTE